MASAIPAMAEQGQDPTLFIELVSAAIDARKKGTPIEDVVVSVMAPEPAPEEEMMMDPAMADPMMTDPAIMQGSPMADQTTAQLMSALNSSGEAQMSARQMTETPI